MTPDLFQLQVLEMKTNGEMMSIKTFILAELQKDRSESLEGLGELIEEVDGPFKAVLFQIFLNDGGADLLPIMSKAIRAESNGLQSKQLLSMAAQMAHPQVIDLIEELEPFVSAEVKSECRQVLGKLKAKFKEHHYTKEFSKGSSNLKRMKAAAGNMLASPHPTYTPFLNEMIGRDDHELSAEAARVLRSLGDASSIEPLFEGLDRLMKQRDKVNRFNQLLGLKEVLSHPRDLIEALAAINDWAENSPEMVALSADPATLKGEVLVAPLNFSRFLTEQSGRFLDEVLSGDVPPDVVRNKLSQALDTHVSFYETRLMEVIQAAAWISRRVGYDGLMARLEAAIPAHEAHRELLLISALAGLGDDVALQRLLSVLDNSQDGKEIDAALDSLKFFKLDTIPDQVRQYAESADNGPARRKALDVVSRHEDGPGLLSEMLHAQALVVRADVVACIAENRIQANYQKLLDLLEDELPVSFLERILEALEAFPGNESGEAAARFIRLPHGAKVRQTAMNTVYRSGGKNKLGILVEALSTYPDRVLDEMLTPFFELLRSYPMEKKSNLFLEQRVFWLKCLCHADEAVRSEIIVLLNKCEWEKADLSGWVETLKECLNTKVVSRASWEEEKLRVFLHRINSIFENARKLEKQREQFEEIIQRLENQSQFEKIQALRQLDQCFKAEMVEGNRGLIKRLVQELRGFIDHHKDNFKMEILAIDVAGKVGHPGLRAKITPYQDHPNWGVAKAAKRALALPVNQKLAGPNIQNVFVLDDSHFITDMVSRILNKKGFQVQVSNDGRSALEILREREFDLLVLDLKMPHMSGLEFLRAAKAENVVPSRRLILTGVRNREDLMEVFQEGVDGVVLKPFDAKGLVAKVKSLDK